MPLLSTANEKDILLKWTLYSQCVRVSLIMALILELGIYSQNVNTPMSVVGKSWSSDSVTEHFWAQEAEGCVLHGGSSWHTLKLHLYSKHSTLPWVHLGRMLVRQYDSVSHAVLLALALFCQGGCASPWHVSQPSQSSDHHIWQDNFKGVIVLVIVSRCQVHHDVESVVKNQKTVVETEYRTGGDRVPGYASSNHFLLLSPNHYFLTPFNSAI